VAKSTPNGRRLAVENADLDFEIGDSKVKLNKLFQGLPLVANRASAFINKNADMVISGSFLGLIMSNKILIIKRQNLNKTKNILHSKKIDFFKKN